MTGEAVKQRVREYMRSWEMTEPGDGLLAGVSGGADSVCLLFLLDELKEELGIRLAAFHLNHGLRGRRSAAVLASLWQWLMKMWQSMRRPGGSPGRRRAGSCGMSI